MKVKYKMQFLKYIYLDSDKEKERGIPVYRCIDVIMNVNKYDEIYTDKYINKADDVAMKILNDDDFHREILPMIEVEVDE